MLNKINIACQFFLLLLRESTQLEYSNLTVHLFFIIISISRVLKSFFFIFKKRIQKKTKPNERIEIMLIYFVLEWNFEYFLLVYFCAVASKAHKSVSLKLVHNELLTQFFFVMVSNILSIISVNIPRNDLLMQQ